MSAAPRFAPAGELRRDESMARHTSWRVGGPADVWFRPASRDDLCAFLAQLDPATPVFWMGLGSNLLVRDGGIRGVVLSTARALGGLHRLDDGRVEAEAGVACTQLARRCAAWGLGPAAFFAGIPGTVGGALRMNAGAFGGETWDHVTDVDTVDRRGQVHRRPREQFQVGYREVHGPAGEWFLAARFALGAASESLDEVRELLRERQLRQPLGLPSCGSVFRNPPGDHAARLIEAAGLKGRRRGGAQVSEKHANFIINTGDASAADVEGLIGEVRELVAQRHGVQLELEVHVVGEPAEARP